MSGKGWKISILLIVLCVLSCKVAVMPESYYVNKYKTRYIYMDSGNYYIKSRFGMYWCREKGKCSVENNMFVFIPPKSIAWCVKDSHNSLLDTYATISRNKLHVVINNNKYILHRKRANRTLINWIKYNY